MDIVRLAEFDLRRIVLPGDYGYLSDYQYEVISSESESGLSFELTLKKRSETYRKIWNEDESTLDIYRRMICDGISLSAMVDKKPAGVLIAEKRDWNNSVWIEKLHVADEFKQKGVGSLMMKEFELLEDLERSRIIYIETQNTNYPAIQFYRKNGFEITGIDVRLYDSKDDLNEAAVFMTKGLSIIS